MSDEQNKSPEELEAEKKAAEELKALEEKAAAEEAAKKEAEEKKAAEEQELNLLKQRADVMGIAYKGNIGIVALKAKIDAAQGGDPEEDEGVSTDNMSESEYEQHMRDEMKRTKLRLIRCRVSNLNPAKNDVRGEIITVANKYLGTVRKFIPFGEQTDGGYHIPQVLVDELNTRKFQQVKTKRVKGQLVNESRMVKEFAIEVMPPLTEDELRQLGDRQAAASRLEGGE